MMREEGGGKLDLARTEASVRADFEPLPFKKTNYLAFEKSGTHYFSDRLDGKFILRYLAASNAFDQVRAEAYGG